VPEGGLEAGAFKARAGALTLSYLTSRVDRDVLLALLAEATTGVEVLEDFEPPEPDDARDIARVFNDSYLLEPVDPAVRPGDPIGPDTMMRPTPAGREVPFVGAVLQRWLKECPYGPMSLGPEASPVLWAVLGGWCSGVIHAVAGGPLTAIDVCATIGVLDGEFVEAHLEAMEGAGLLEALFDEGDEERGEPRYLATGWLRRGIAPLAAAARMEHRYPPGDTAPIAALDANAAFLLTLPLLELPPELSGTCSLSVDLDEGVVGSPTGVTVAVEDGRVTRCEVGLDEDGADAWASASAARWLDTVIEAEAGLVECGGDSRLAEAIFRGLHEALFA
jgi:hypothetical protein